MLKKVLIISPHFPPVNAADAHRVRMYLPFFRQNGWEPSIVYVDPKLVEMSQDPLLCNDLPNDMQQHVVSARSINISRKIRSRTIAKRCFNQIKNKVDQILSEETFDLVFFSTTAFGLFKLGLRWLKRFNIPYVIDLQDPWINPFYKDNPQVPRPGGSLKYWLVSQEAKYWEPRVFKKAAGIVVVSPKYKTMINKRYGNAITPDKLLTLPFGASELDFKLLQAHSISQDFFDPTDGHIHLIHIGRGGDDLKQSLTLLFNTFLQYKQDHPEQAEPFRFHFIGTSYAPSGQSKPTIKPVAKEVGIADFVHEHPMRIPYYQALRCLQQASSIIMPLSSDPGYNPSKLYTNLLTGKPIMAIAPEDSIAAQNLRHAGQTVHLCEYNNETRARDENVMAWWTKAISNLENPQEQAVDTPFEANHLSQKLCEFFDHCLKHPH